MKVCNCCRVSGGFCRFSPSSSGRTSTTILGFRSQIPGIFKKLLARLNQTTSVHSNPSHQSIRRNYEIYWNVPSELCNKYGIYYPEVSDDYNMIQNVNDSFRGNNITILYHPGRFPMLLKGKNDTFTAINGGVPQRGNLSEHLRYFEADVRDQTDRNFSGIGIIDFEYWRPIYRQNWGDALVQYRNYSEKLIQIENPSYDNDTLRRRATTEFQRDAKNFLKSSIKTAKRLRPDASWGYYNYPECFNLSPGNLDFHCHERVQGDNDRLKWLWNITDVLLPSIYPAIALSDEQKIGLINGRLTEARRVLQKYEKPLKLYPYFWYKYKDSIGDFVTRKDIDDTFNEVLNHDADGHVIWGSYHDFDSQEQCEKFKNYLNTILGPAMRDIKARADKKFNKIINDK